MVNFIKIFIFQRFISEFLRKFQSVRIWNMASKECKMTLHEHEHVVECIAWAPDKALPYIKEADESDSGKFCV